MKELSKEQLAALKAKHGDVFQITVEDKCCYVKKPSRKALGFASMAAKENPLKFNEVILNESWLDGDEEIREDDYLFLSASTKLADIIQIKEAEIKKL